LVTKRHKRREEKLTTNKHEWTQFFTAESAEIFLITGYADYTENFAVVKGGDFGGGRIVTTDSTD
jgi:hypothetical protein